MAVIKRCVASLHWRGLATAKTSGNFSLRVSADVANCGRFVVCVSFVFAHQTVASRVISGLLFQSPSSSEKLENIIYNFSQSLRISGLLQIVLNHYNLEYK